MWKDKEDTTIRLQSLIRNEFKEAGTTQVLIPISPSLYDGQIPVLQIYRQESLEDLLAIGPERERERNERCNNSSSNSCTWHYIGNSNRNAHSLL
jgi:hypothetical protein